MQFLIFSQSYDYFLIIAFEMRQNLEKYRNTINLEDTADALSTGMVSTLLKFNSIISRFKFPQNYGAMSIEQKTRKMPLILSHLIYFLKVRGIERRVNSCWNERESSGPVTLLAMTRDSSSSFHRTITVPSSR